MRVFLCLFLFLISCSVQEPESLRISSSLDTPKYKVIKIYNQDEYVVTNIITNPAAHYLIVMTIRDYYIYKKLITIAKSSSTDFYSKKTKESLRKSILADSNEINFYKNNLIKIGVGTNVYILSNLSPGSFIYDSQLK